MKVHRIFRSLAMKLYILILLLVIPINLLVLFLSQMILQDYQDELRQSYRHELDIFYTQVNSDLSNLQSTLLSLTGGEWLSVYGGYMQDTSLKTNQFYAELKNLCNTNSLIDCAYLLQSSTGRTFLAYSTQKYNHTEMQPVKEDLLNGQFEPCNGFSYPIVTLAGEQFLAVSLCFQDSFFGALIKVDSLLSSLKNREKEGDLSVVLVDSGGTVVYASSDGLVGETAGGSDQYLLTGSFVTGQQVGFYLGNSGVLDTVPFFYDFLILMSAFSVLIIPLIWLLIRREVTRPIRVIERAMKEFGEDHLEYRIEERASTDQFQYLYTSCNNMARDLRGLMIDNYEKELERLKLERNSLLLQVSPHMLLNSLSMIYSLSLSKNDAAIQAFTRNLMQYFRYVLRENRDFVSLREELAFVESYLGIQKIRYPGRFTYVYKMEDELGEIMILPFLIENFIENAVKYALAPDRVIEIILNIRLEEDMLLISIVDTGNGMDAERLRCLNAGEVIEDCSGRHIGIWNCRRRIQMYFGERADLHFSSVENGGTQVWMALPYRELDVNRDKLPNGGEQDETADCGR